MENAKGLVDYAMPCMLVEKAMKLLHNAMLNRDYDTALQCAKVAIVESKMTYNAILHEKEQDEQRRRIPT